MNSTLSRFAWVLRDPFRGIAADPAVLAKTLEQPLPGLRYAILFMPRSSSTRLTQILRQTGCLGAPLEWFNPKLIQRIAPELGAGNRSDYVQALLRSKASGGVFGTEITWLQMLALFRSERTFLAALQPDRLIWLIREDMVAQAVSSVRMVQTGVAQTIRASRADHARDEAAHHYDPKAIARSLRRLAWQESRSEAFVQRATQPVLRISYEQLVASSDAQVLSRIATFLDVPPRWSQPPASTIEKLGGAKSAEFAAQFRKDYPRLVAKIDRLRQPRLNAIHPLP